MLSRPIQCRFDGTFANQIETSTFEYDVPIKDRYFETEVQTERKRQNVQIGTGIFEKIWYLQKGSFKQLIRFKVFE